MFKNGVALLFSLYPLPQQQIMIRDAIFVPIDTNS